MMILKQFNALTPLTEKQRKLVNNFAKKPVIKAKRHGYLKVTKHCDTCGEVDVCTARFCPFCHNRLKVN